MLISFEFLSHTIPFRDLFDPVSCHVSTSAVTHPQLVLDSGFSMAITMPDILEKSFPCGFEAYIVYVLGLASTW